MDASVNGNSAARSHILLRVVSVGADVYIYSSNVVGKPDVVLVVGYRS